MTATSTSRFRSALLVSVALNLLLGAALAANWWQQGHRVGHGHGHGQGHGRGIGGAVRMPRAETLARVLPPADHAALDAAYARHRVQVHAGFRAMRESKREVRAALNAQPFDAARLDAALASMRAHEQDVARSVHALLIDVSSNVSSEGRAAVSKLVTNRRSHSRRGRTAHGDRVAEPKPTPTP